MSALSPQIIGFSCVIVATTLEAFGQLAFKRAADADHIGADAMTGLRSLLHSPGWIGGGIACFLVEGVIFSIALRLLDVSVAFPAGALAFVMVALLSRVVLKEAVGSRRWAGVGLILVGVGLVAGT